MVMLTQHKIKRLQCSQTSSSSSSYWHTHYCFSACFKRLGRFSNRNHVPMSTSERFSNVHAVRSGLQFNELSRRMPGPRYVLWYFAGISSMHMEIYANACSVLRKLCTPALCVYPCRTVKRRHMIVNQNLDHEFTTRERVYTLKG